MKFHPDSIDAVVDLLEHNRLTYGCSVIIGDNCLIGADVTFTDTDFHPITPNNRRFSRVNVGVKPVVIEDNVFIGTKSIILKGVTIGENSIIGAGSVVVNSIPKNVIAAGNPCRVIRDIVSK